MNDDVFLRQIIANPRDDGPRLVYADYLEEQGDADRAELIRIQISIPNLVNESRNFHEASMRLMEANRRSNILLEANPQWASPVASIFRQEEMSLTARHQYGYGGTSWVRWEWVRGFISKIRMPYMYWQRNGVAVLAVAPITDVAIVANANEDFWNHPADALEFLSSRWPGINFHIQRLHEFQPINTAIHSISSVQPLNTVVHSRSSVSLSGSILSEE
jgi:uncharacterized protein (TIGR02996 family)